VLFDRICLNNGIKHLLTAPYSPTTTGKIERLHKTMRKEFFSTNSFETIEQAQDALDAWVVHYNHDREHQAIGDAPPIKRFELASRPSLEVIDGEVAIEEVPQPTRRVVGRRVDEAGRIRILKHRYHVGRYLAGQTVTIESKDGLLHVTHNGVVVATHARRHLIEDDDKMDRRSTATTPAPPTKGGEVFRGVDRGGSVSFAGTGYRVGNGFIGRLAGVRLVGRHCADHDRRQACANPPRSSRQIQGVRSIGPTSRQAEKESRCGIATGAILRHGYRDCTGFITDSFMSDREIRAPESPRTVLPSTCGSQFTLTHSIGER
jgi:hypothetical protein